jgi:N-carbamoyl-L-amino-acid hydrolase
MEIDSERLRRDVLDNGEFGAIADAEHGRTNLTGTPANAAARDRLVERMEAAGLDVSVDAVGTIVGRWTPPSADPDADPVAAGSHLDSVPRGGIFDGPLGVYGALEAVRAIEAAGLEPDRPIEVVSFTEEEGTRFAGGLLGSSVAAGARSVADALALTDDEGTTLEAALDEIDYRGDDPVDAADWHAWVELHPEQDTELEAAGVPVGVVTTITGIAHRRVTVEGAADHAGATGMDERRDALAAAAEIVGDVERAGRAVAASESDTAVATVGELDVEPNATNVVPGRAVLGVDVRDVRRDTMDEMLRRLERSADRVADTRPVETSVETEVDVDPRPMSDRVRRAAQDAGERAGVATMDMPSGAAHDTMYVGDATEAGLLFAPSVDGVSHNPAEWTDWDDCATATRVFAETLADLAGARPDGA